MINDQVDIKIRSLRIFGEGYQGYKSLRTLLLDCALDTIVHMVFSLDRRSVLLVRQTYNRSFTPSPLFSSSAF